MSKTKQDTRLHECCKCRHVFFGHEMLYMSKRGHIGKVGTCPECNCGTHYCLNPDGSNARLGDWEYADLSLPEQPFAPRVSAKKRGRILAAIERFRKEETP